jgi:hypothetical protein
LRRKEALSISDPEAFEVLILMVAVFQKRKSKIENKYGVRIGLNYFRFLLSMFY